MTTQEIIKKKKEAAASGEWYSIEDAVAETIMDNIEKCGGLPALEGTEKQIKWAQDLRNEQIKYVISYCSEKIWDFRDNEKYLDQLNYMLEASGIYFAHQQNAKIYIEWRNSIKHRAEIDKIARDAWEKER